MILRSLRLESYRKGIVASSVLNVVSKATAFITSLVIAYCFGTQTRTDLYFYCITTVTVLSVLVTSIDSAVLIPESMHLRERSGGRAAMAFLNRFLYLYLAIGVTLALFIAVRPVTVFLAVSKFDKAALVSNSNILAASGLLLIFMVVATYLVDILASHKYFTMPMIVNMVNNIISLAFLAVFYKRLGILSLMIGLLVGYSIQSVFLVYAMKVLLQWDFAVSNISIGAKNIKNIGYSYLGNVATALSAYVPFFLLSGFAPGVVASLNYAQQVSGMPTNTVTAQFSSVAGIKLNELAAKREWKKINDVFLSSANILLFVMIPISLLIFLYNREILTVLFRRGAFDQRSVDMSAGFLRYLSLLLPLFVVNTIVARLFMAGQKVLQALWNQAIVNIALIVAICFGVRYFGIGGYLGALLIVHVVNVFCCCYYLIKIFFPTIDYRHVLVQMVRLLAVNVVLCGGVAYMKRSVHFSNDALSIFAGTALYGAGLLAMSMVFHLDREVTSGLSRLGHLFTAKRV